MSWFWLNIPLGAVFFLATAGIPLWVVLRHPDARPARAGASDAAPQSQPVVVPVMAARPVPRELVGASSGPGGG